MYLSRWAEFSNFELEPAKCFDVCATKFAEWFVICVQRELPCCRVVLAVRHSVD
jgi:hypothetical protein